MLQERELVPLMKQLLQEGYRVLLETSGERPLERVPAEVVKIVDVKCPDSGEADTFHTENLSILNSQDEVKFVISSRADYEFARDFTRTQSRRAGECSPFFPRISKRCRGRSRQFALPRRSPGISRVDACR